jgi:hypothetical protein
MSRMPILHPQLWRMTFALRPRAPYLASECGGRRRMRGGNHEGDDLRLHDRLLRHRLLLRHERLSLRLRLAGVC